MRKSNKIPVTQIDGSKNTTIEVDLNTFSLDIIKACCYRFSNNFFSSLKTEGLNALVTFNFPENTSPEKEREVLHEFNHDLIDQDIREKVYNKTEMVRNLILANAFSNSRLADSE